MNRSEVAIWVVWLSGCALVGAVSGVLITHTIVRVYASRLKARTR